MQGHRRRNTRGGDGGGGDRLSTICGPIPELEESVLFSPLGHARHVFEGGDGSASPFAVPEEQPVRDLFERFEGSSRLSCIAAVSVTADGAAEGPVPGKSATYRGQ